MKSDIEGGRGLAKFPELVPTNGANNTFVKDSFAPQIQSLVKIPPEINQTIK